MAVKAGYKQTEVGVIPQEWEVKFLREVAQIRSGVAKNINVAVTNPIRVHYLRVANVQDGFLDLSEMNQIEISRGDLQRYAVLPGDVLMNEGGDLDKLGRGAIWQGEFNPCVHQNHVFVVRCGSTVDSTYINIWSAGSVARRYFLVAGKQTTNLASINKTALGELPVAVPPLAEQQAIADALSDVDGLISALDALIAKKRAIKQGAMQELLTGQRRLPGFAGEWAVKMLGELAVKIGSGITPTGGERVYTEEGHPFIRSQNVGWGELLMDDIAYIDDETHNSFKATEIQNQDVLLNITGASIGRSAVADQRVERGNVNQHVCIIRPVENELNPYFLNSFLLSGEGQKQIDSFQSGGNRQGLNFGQIRTFMIPLPTLAEQTAIAQLLADLDGELAALAAKRAKTVAVKAGMMQTLLTGQVRLV